MFGFKKGTKRSVRHDAKDHPPKQDKPSLAVAPPLLGTGFAASAARKIRNRRAAVDEAAGFANGGMILGPGTGTSDDIPKAVPGGTYIMPADSTEQIGPEQLAAMGQDPTGGVPVRVSNGEYELPPEQVHAIGAQVLDQMKDATHTPVAQPRGFKPGAARTVQGDPKRPELFFADGGMVEDERRRDRGATQQQPGLVERTLQLPRGSAKIAAGALTQLPARGFDMARSGITRALGGDPSTLPGGRDALTTRSLDLLESGVDDTSAVLERGRVAALGVLGAQERAPAAPAPAPAVKSPEPAAPPVRDTQPATVPAAPVSASAPASSQPKISDTSVAGIKRVDGVEGAPNLFTDNPERAISDAAASRRGFNPKAAEQARDGRLNVGTTSVPAAGFSPQAAQDYLVNLTPGPGGRYQSAAESGYRPGGISIRDSSGLDPRRTGFNPRAFRAQRMQQDLDLRRSQQQQDFDLRREDLAERRAARLQEFDPNRSRLSGAQAGLAETQAAQAQQLQQLANQLATETDPTRRAQLQEALLAAQGKTGGENRQRPLRVQMPTEAGRQVELLRQQLLQETDPERRAAIQSSLMAIGDAKLEEDAIYDPDSGTTTRVGAGDQSARTGAPQPPRAGEVRSGYRFKGGNPADQKNWEKV